MGSVDDVIGVARRPRDVIEPVVGQVHFAPECHEAYAAMALGDDADELFAILAPWGEAIRAAGGYPAGPRDLVRSRG